MYYHEIHLVPRNPFQDDPFTRVIVFSSIPGLNLAKASQFLSKIYPSDKVYMVSRYVPSRNEYSVRSQLCYVHTDVNCPYLWHKLSDGISISRFAFAAALIWPKMVLVMPEAMPLIMPILLCFRSK